MDGGGTEAARAGLYKLLAAFLARPPDGALLDLAAGLRGPATPLGRALDELALRAAASDPEAAAREHEALFIGLARGELVPYASWYLTGFLHDRPLARLRQDMAALGLERQPGVAEPEDHIAAVCEVMATLTAEAADAAGEARERRFFDRHLAPWAGRFFKDLEGARAAVLYRPLGTLGRLFVEIEAAAWELQAPERDLAPVDRQPRAASAADQHWEAQRDQAN